MTTGYMVKAITEKLKRMGDREIRLAYFFIMRL